MNIARIKDYLTQCVTENNGFSLSADEAITLQTYFINQEMEKVELCAQLSALEAEKAGLEERLKKYEQ